MYIKFCINKIKLRDLEIHTAEYNDTYIYDKKYYVLYKIPFHFFFSWNSFSIRLKFYKTIYTCQWMPYKMWLLYTYSQYMYTNELRSIN